MRWSILWVACVSLGARAEPLVHVRWDRPPEGLRLHEGLKVGSHNGRAVLEFTGVLQHATLPVPKGVLDKVEGLTVSMWVSPRRYGEQYFLSRGEVSVGRNGERFFRPEKDYVTVLVGM